MATLGRVGVGTSLGGDGLVIPDPFEVQQQGRQISMAGYYRAASAVEAVWVRDQILGLDPANNPDETAVPMTFTDTNLNGYYSITSASASIPRGSLGSGGLLHVDWSISAERAVSWRRSRVELPTTYAFVTNVMGGGLTTADILHAYPALAEVYAYPSNTNSSAANRVGEHGDVQLGYFDATGSSSQGTGVGSYSIAPANFYAASCKIDHNMTDGSGRRNIIGRRDIDDLTRVRLSNGLVRVDVGPATDVNVSWYVSGVWESGSIFQFSNAGSNTVTFTDAVILKNSPEECTLRLYGYFASLSRGNTATVDITIRRGHRIAWFYASANWSPTWRFAHSGTIAYTTQPYGLRRSSTIDGNYTVLMSDQASTRDAVNGRLTCPSARQRCLFMAGCSAGSSTSSIPDGADDVGYQGYVSIADSQRVVTG